MTDVHSPDVRSFNMSRILAKNTKPELIVRKFLFKEGFRFRLHQKDLPGKPDIVLSKLRTIIFINGCFWHGHLKGKNCFKFPKTNARWWKNKITKNKINEARFIKKLKTLEWYVMVIWECQLKIKKRNSTLLKLKGKLLSRIK